MISLRGQWREGPSAAYPLEPPHGRPIFCMATEGSMVVTGSADHGLREYNMDTGKYVRELFGKKYGHKEWVSTCAYSNGRVMSGAMDSVVCLWDASGVRCDHFGGHSGSISKVMASGDIGISASYDTSIIVWDFKKKKDCERLMGAHKDAVMDFVWHNSLLVSGDKNGLLAIWDLNEGKAVQAIKTHKGAVSNIKFASDGDDRVILSTGLNDGTLVVHDMRTHLAVYQEMVHKGSVNCLTVHNGIIGTASADHYLRLFSLNGMKPLHKIDTQDMLFAMEHVDDLTIVGTGGGNILTYDNHTGECLYGFGVMKKGVCRLLGLNKKKTRLACAGEDDNGMLLCFD